MHCVLCLMLILLIQDIKESHASMFQIPCYAYVNTVDSGVCSFYPNAYRHISVHNFVNIQWIFNPEKVLKS